MNKEQLLATAEELPKVPAEVLSEYAKRREQMVGMINEIMAEEKTTCLFP